MNRLIFILCVLVILGSLSVSTADTKQAEDIESLSVQKQVLDSLLDIKKSEVEQLYLIDEQLHLTTTLINKLERKKKNASRTLADLADSISHNSDNLERIKVSLARNINSFYISYQPTPAAIFSAGDIQKAARQLHYFKTTLNFIKSQIDSVNTLTEELETNQKQQRRVRSETDRLVQRKNLEESLLEMRKKEKSKLLTSIEDDVSLRRQYLDQMRKNREELADLTKQIEPESVRDDFMALKGSLPWPAKGKIVRHFGREYDKLTKTETFSPGIDIRMLTGTEINVVESGKIIHANYLRGYGNIVIVDHGGGWYTLYGHLSQISREKGDNITRGEIIGFSGETGSNIGPALFFGIRNREESFDPIEWLN
jgi:murein hydrolase activator